jgi:hypothetical protein
MNLSQRTLGAMPAGGTLPDEMDDLLRGFFCREMPPSWPAWKPPAQVGHTSPRRTPLLRGRFALAASLLFLLGGQLLLSGAFLERAGLTTDQAGGTNEATRRTGISSPQHTRPVFGPRTHGPKLPQRADEVTVPSDFQD